VTTDLTIVLNSSQNDRLISQLDQVLQDILLNWLFLVSVVGCLASFFIANAITKTQSSDICALARAHDHAHDEDDDDDDYYYYYKSIWLEWHCHISCFKTTVQKYKNSIKCYKNA